ncbi:FliM/FliN family flagellar motor switch protein [Shimia biformata]|uniref:FliM/FliN family flagellar motor switch protein n=1 Tax=Shimia biformata TaxID=1294299 RepID=UPI001951FE98|nr:FliM/FliN family flagellar motor switch protein [Shimia biformata]
MVEEKGSARTANAFSDLPVEITVAVGRARPLIGELLSLQNDAILTLDRRIDDPVDLYVGDRIVARGELVELDGEKSGQIGVRLTEVVGLTGMDG